MKYTTKEIQAIMIELGSYIPMNVLSAMYDRLEIMERERKYNAALIRDIRGAWSKNGWYSAGYNDTDTDIQ